MDFKWHVFQIYQIYQDLAILNPKERKKKYIYIENFCQMSITWWDFVCSPLVWNFTPFMRPHLWNHIYSFSKSVSLSVCRGLETQITFNKTIPPNSRAQKLSRTSSSYFLLLLLCPFPRSNCQRSLLLTFIFTSVSAQQLSSSMGEVFLGFGGWVRRFGCAFLGLRV